MELSGESGDIDTDGVAAAEIEGEWLGAGEAKDVVAGGKGIAVSRLAELGKIKSEVEAAFDRNGRALWVSEDPVAAIVTMAALDMEIDFANV